MGQFLQGGRGRDGLGGEGGLGERHEGERERDQGDRTAQKVCPGRIFTRRLGRRRRIRLTA